MKKELALKIIATLIAVMLFYAAASKLVDYDRSKEEMMNQVFPREIALVLVWAIPSVELLIVALLLFQGTRLMGLFAANGLLLAFSCYIVIAMTGAFGKIPCSCGGILENMSYGTHLLFNMFFMLLGLYGIALEKGWIDQKIITLEKKGDLPKIE